MSTALWVTVHVANLGIQAWIIWGDGAHRLSGTSWLHPTWGCPRRRYHGGRREAELTEPLQPGHRTGGRSSWGPHQANLRISEGVQKALGLPDERVYNNIQKYGNTTAATIPIALDECRKSGRIRPGQLVCFVGLGSGFHWGAALMRA